jgi:hypothetical protein
MEAAIDFKTFHWAVLPFSIDFWGENAKSNIYSGKPVRFIQNF